MIRGFLIAALMVVPLPETALSQAENSGTTTPLFESMEPEHTGIKFFNAVEEGVGSNVLESNFFYNGTGVAAGDINGDGLPDLFFTANTGRNALYLNEGGFRFRDITEQTGVGRDIGGWTAGTSMADVNGDRLLDIHVCRAGEVESEARRNRLYINNGDLTFSERAAEFGLDDSGYCTQAVFFDYDMDGDLDAYIVNYSVQKSTMGFDLQSIRNQYEPGAADRLYRNDNGTFTDVSSEVGLIQNPMGFGLSATVSDLDKNGLPDIYVGNDFIERDYLYMNQGNGKFNEKVLARMDITSYFSMGSDIADINNDGFSDILVADMLPYEYSRERMFNTPNYSNFDQIPAMYRQQNMRNVLQLNNGNGTFTEIGQLSGVSRTDWSWAPLIADFDNDGYKDIFITNGFPRFVTNFDFLKMLYEKYPGGEYPDDPEVKYNLVRQMEKVKLHNFAFKNMGDLLFKDVSEQWGLNQHAVSNGIAYADLDNNGTLDLVVSNINESPYLFRNNAHQHTENNYLKVRLRGTGQNSHGTGAKVTITDDDENTFYQENFPVRGYQSSVEPVLLFGVGREQYVDLEVIWPDGAYQVFKDLSVNQTFTVYKEDAIYPEKKQEKKKNHLFSKLKGESLGLDFIHRSGANRDLAAAPLLPHTLTNQGPALASGDVNGDGLKDLYIGGGGGQSGALYLQGTDGKFSRIRVAAFEQHSYYQDVDALFFDVNGDGLQDLYVVSGGNHDPTNGSLYQDRLYFNDGSGNFSHAAGSLPSMPTSGSVVCRVELNGDGRPDLFVGGRVVTGSWPSAPRSYLLSNQGGHFRDVTEELAPGLASAGMVTDAAWADLNANGLKELIITGEWMPMRVFSRSQPGKYFTEITSQAGLNGSSGWWNTVQVADLDGDGDLDLVGGNRGMNYDLKAPAEVWAEDFNDDEVWDPILTRLEEGRNLPVAGRDRLLRQLPGWEERFPDYSSYAQITLKDILQSDQREKVLHLRADTFSSMVFLNDGKGRFEMQPLPRQAQIAPLYDIIVYDFNQDGNPDILAGGNTFGNSAEQGSVTGQGILLIGDGQGEFTPIRARDTGFIGGGEIRNMRLLNPDPGSLLILARHGASLLLYRYGEIEEDQ